MAEARYRPNHDDSKRKEGSIGLTVTAENLPYHEIAGLHATIVNSTDTTLRGVSGVILSETRNTIFVEVSQGKTLQVAKKAAEKIRVVTGPGVCFISGSSLIGKPEDRLARLNY